MRIDELNAVAESFTKIRVPLSWAGRTRKLADGSLAWTCGACPDADACAATGVCARASEDALNRAGIAMPGPRREGD